MLALLHAFLFLLFWDEEVEGVGIGIDLNAIGDEGSSGQAKSFDHVVLEGAIVDGAGAAGWASILKDGNLDSEEVADGHGLFCSFDVLFGAVFAGFGKD